MSIRRVYPVWAAMLAALLVLSSCVAAPTALPAMPAQAATVAPTQAPLPAPTQAATAAPAAAGALTAQPWQWVSFTNPVEQFDVEKPESYLLTFNKDGTVSIKADCNNAGGSYTADTPSAGVLALKIGPATLVACPPGSRGEQFVKLLGGAARYFFKDGKLFIDLMADGGTFAFAPAGKPAPAAATPGALTTQPWQWVSFTSPVEQVQIDKPENYVLTFNKDGAVEIKADCNRAGGTYTTTADGALTIKVGPTTMAACPPPSRGEQFVKLLGGAARYFFKDGKLFIDLMADGGTFMLAPA